MQEVDRMNSDSLSWRMHTAGNARAGGRHRTSLHQSNSSEIAEMFKLLTLLVDSE